MRNAIIVFAALGLLGLGCEQFELPPTELDCTGDADQTRVVGDVLAFGSPAASAHVRVEGQARHLDGLAIHQVLVADVPATQKEGAFNFDHWAVDVPLGVLEAMGPDPATGTVTLTVDAVDACRDRHAFATVDIVVAPVPVIDVLDVAVDYPNAETYLPADVSVPALVTVTATATATGAGAAVGVDVTLEASEGTFLDGGTGAATTTLTLQPVDGQRATAFAYFSGDTPGRAVLTAIAQTKIASQVVPVAGPPLLVPGSGTLLPGSSTEITVFTDGRVDACEVIAPLDVTVTYLGAAVNGTVTIDPPVAGLRTRFLVSVDAALATPVTLLVICRDAYGQSGSGSYDAAP